MTMTPSHLAVPFTGHGRILVTKINRGLSKVRLGQYEPYVSALLFIGICINQLQGNEPQGIYRLRTIRRVYLGP